MAHIRTVVVDADALARARVTALLRQDPAIELVGEAADGHAALALVRERAPALMFLDVQMPHLDGFGVLDALDPTRLPATVFLTAHEQYALRAFEAHALDYLLKPYSDDRFAAALTRARRLLAAIAPAVPAPAAGTCTHCAALARPPYLDRLAIKAGGRVLLVDVQDVDWIEACGVYVNVHVGGRVHVHRASMAYLMQRLDPRRFVRVHRSTAVNTSRIRELRARGHGDFTVVLRDGTEVVLSRSCRTGFEGWLGQSL